MRYSALCISRMQPTQILRRNERVSRLIAAAMSSSPRVFAGGADTAAIAPEAELFRIDLAEGG